MPAALYTSSLATSLGELALAVDEAGALVAVAFAAPGDLALRCGPDVALTPDASRTSTARAELAAYFAGTRREFTVPLAARLGTPHQRRVWQALLRIPFGTTWSYARLAAETGGVARAVGAANGANPLCIVVPCHRVIGADGSLTGYAGGLERKRALLLLEGALLT